MRVRLAVAFFMLVLAVPVRAQDKETLCRDIQTRPMRVGQWASYQWSGGRADGGTMRFALVGTEAQEGTTYYWYEMSINDPKKGAKGKTIIQMLVPGLSYEMGGVRGMIMKSGDDAAMRMPDQMVRMMAGRAGAGRNIAAEIARSCREMELVGWEQVTVPAGTFRALHIRDPHEKTEAWVVPDFYFGMVKAVMKDGTTMELTGRGGDARSSITETPRAMMGP